MDNKKLKRVIWVVLIAIAVFAYLDQTPSFLNSRESVFLFLWYFTLTVIAWVYYIFRRDKSEALAIFTIGMVELFTGLEDFLFFTIYKLQGKAVEFCVNHSLDQWQMMNVADKYILGNTCTTHLGLFLNAVIIGGFISYFTYKWLLRQPW